MQRMAIIDSYKNTLRLSRYDREGNRIIYLNKAIKTVGGVLQLWKTEETEKHIKWMPSKNEY